MIFFCKFNYTKIRVLRTSHRRLVHHRWGILMMADATYKSVMHEDLKVGCFLKFSEVWEKSFPPQVAIASENGLNLALIELVDGNPLKFYFGITLTPLKFWKFVDGIRILIFFCLKKVCAKLWNSKKRGLSDYQPSCENDADNRQAYCDHNHLLQFVWVD